MFIPGLKLRFNIEINEYIPEITQDAGVKLTITQPNEMPFPLYQSLSLAPGFKTDIALKRVNNLIVVLFFLRLFFSDYYLSQIHGCPCVLHKQCFIIKIEINIKVVNCRNSTPTTNHSLELHISL